MSRIWKVSLPKENFLEPKENYVCSQGWHQGGDLSFVYYYYHRNEMAIPVNIPREIREILNKNDEYVVDFFWNDTDNRARFAFKRLFKEIKAGDIIVAYDGKKPKFIGEIPNEHTYYFNKKLIFPNALFPIKYYDIEEVINNINKIKPSRQGVVGIQEDGGKDDILAKKFIKENWGKFKTKNNIKNVFPEEKRNEYEALLKAFPENIEKSKKQILEKIHQMKTRKLINEYLTLLQSNKNLIFHGAPGTGKTYLAKQIAWEIILENIKLGQEFKTIKGKIFTVTKKTLQTLTIKPKDGHKDEGIPILIKDVKKCFEDYCFNGKVSDNDKITGPTYVTTLAKYIFEKNFTGFVQFHPSYDYTDFVEGLRPVKSKGSDEIGFDIKDGIFKAFCNRAKNDSDNNYVFIIDEINRADISKVFGELFFALDTDYRGPAGSVKTQYYNLHGQEFYIPENVYIIGTMNDIDRSVDTFDFAIRRRFTWIELKANDVVEQILTNETIKDNNLLEQAKIKLENLNKAIENIEGLNSSYHIGPAYFLKLNKYNESEAFGKLWDYHLEPLLREYLRGMPDVEEKIQELKTAYNNESKPADEND